MNILVVEVLIRYNLNKSDYLTVWIVSQISVEMMLWSGYTGFSKLTENESQLITTHRRRNRNRIQFYKIISFIKILFNYKVKIELTTQTK